MSVNSEEQFADILDEIYTWLEQIPFSRPRRNLVRDFSNGVFMAELLKQYYPRHVDLHNYSPSSSISKKLDNWRTLNRKVLTKIDMKLSDDVIYQIASAQSKAIDSVLIKLRSRILKDCNDERRSLYTASDLGISNSEVDSVLDLDEVQNKKIPRPAFLKLKQELQEKNDMVAMLGEKIFHLESLIKLKDQRIADLSAQLTRLNKLS
ncbi:sperm flagellar protein 1-like [Fopius arisanus]|uniref:Sperm flagellar protein 1-like n=2 Tax=Fopius arisanus TaxID=64838 RepID=A0A9R1T3V0_9HYME|nr:PREDICTED: sperm flagellar protein 1-like [Fopius arisanus]